MDIAQPAAAPPQLSPDGKWWWDGRQWLPVPAPPAPALPPTPPVGSVLPGYGAQQPAAVGYQQAPAAGTDGLAIASFVLSIIWVLGLGSIAAVVLGHVSRRKAASEGRPKSGLALAGLILGYLGIAGLVLGIAVAAIGARGASDVQHRAAVSSDLRTVANEEEIYFTDHNTYTDLATLQAQGQALALSQDVDLTVISASTVAYCLSATQSDVTYYYSSSSGGLQSQPCS
jgi:hypothetical protein